MNAEQTAAELIRHLERWVGFREGYGAVLLDRNASEWSEHTDATNYAADLLADCSPERPIETLLAALQIMARAQGTSLRGAMRSCINCDSRISRLIVWLRDLTSADRARGAV